MHSEFLELLKSNGFEVFNATYKNDETPSVQVGKYQIFTPTEDFPTFLIIYVSEYGNGEKSLEISTPFASEVLEFLINNK